MMTLTLIPRVYVCMTVTMIKLHIIGRRVKPTAWPTSGVPAQHCGGRDRRMRGSRMGDKGMRWGE